MSSITTGSAPKALRPKKPKVKLAKLKKVKIPKVGGSRKGKVNTPLSSLLKGNL